MVKFEQSTEKDFSKLAALWGECFGDGKDIVKQFFDLTEPAVFVAREGQRILSMACALDTCLVDEDGDTHSAVYLYAVCTAPDFRGRGLFRKLLTFVENSLKNQVEYAVLVPSEEALFDFYRRLGYETAFCRKCYEIPAGGTAKITKIQADSYENLREMQLYGNFLSYNLPLLKWQGVLGGFYRIETAEGIYCAAAGMQGKTLQIRELLPDSPSAAAALASHLHCERATVCTVGGGQPFGMAKSLQSGPLPKTAYLGLAFE